MATQRKFRIGAWNRPLITRKYRCRAVVRRTNRVLYSVVGRNRELPQTLRVHIPDCDFDGENVTEAAQKF